MQAIHMEPQGRRALGRVLYQVGVSLSSIRSVFPWGNLYPKSIEVFFSVDFFPKACVFCIPILWFPAKEEQFPSLFGLDLISYVWDELGLFKSKTNERQHRVVPTAQSKDAAGQSSDLSFPVANQNPAVPALIHGWHAPVK